MKKEKKTDKADEAVKELGKKMCGYIPETLEHIKEHNPDLAVLIRDMDKIMVEDGALDKKTKRLIALARAINLLVFLSSAPSSTMILSISLIKTARSGLCSLICSSVSGIYPHIFFPSSFTASSALSVFFSFFIIDVMEGVHI